MQKSNSKIVKYHVFIGGIIVAIAVLTYLFHLFLTKVLGASFSPVALILFIIILGSSFSFSIHGYYKKIFRGQSLDTSDEGIETIIPQSPRLYFVLLIPLLFPLFAYIYNLCISLGVFFMLLLFWNLTDAHLKFIANIMIAISCALSFLTLRWIWREMKKWT